jgi:hypothetical protein
MGGTAMTTNTQQKYISIGTRLRTKKYAKIAKAAKRTRQAVHAALSKSKAKDKLISSLTAHEKSQDRAFAAAVSTLAVNTAFYQPRELARLVGMPGYPRALEALQEAGIPHAQPRLGAYTSSELVRFAQTLPNTHELTARQIADLGGFTLKCPSRTLKRNGIAFLPGKAGGKRGKGAKPYPTSTVAPAP